MQAPFVTGHKHQFVKDGSHPLTLCRRNNGRYPLCFAEDILLGHWRRSLSYIHHKSGQLVPGMSYTRH